MIAALETVAGYVLAFLITLGLVWCLDRWVFFNGQPGLFS